MTIVSNEPDLVEVRYLLEQMAERRLSSCFTSTERSEWDRLIALESALLGGMAVTPPSS